MSIKLLRASTGTRLELWDTQLQRHVIASQHGVHRRGGGGGGGGFLMGKQGFIRAIKFTGSVARLLKEGQPGFLFKFRALI